MKKNLLLLIIFILGFIAGMLVGTPSFLHGIIDGKHDTYLAPPNLEEKLSN